MFKYFWYTVLKQKPCTDKENGMNQQITCLLNHTSSELLQMTTVY